MQNHLKTASYIADLLDNKFKVLGFRFGIDPLLGLIPGGGDLVSFLLSLYIVWIGVKFLAGEMLRIEGQWARLLWVVLV